MKKNKANLIVPDTNVLISDLNAIENLLNSENLVVIPLTVLKELDNLKNDRRIGIEARQVIKIIEDYVFKKKDESLIIEKNCQFSDLNLDKGKADDQIMATFNYILNEERFSGYQKYKLITDDINMRIIAYGLFSDFENVSIEGYKANLVSPDKIQDLPKFKLVEESLALDYSVDIFGDIPENGGIILEGYSVNGKGRNSQESLAVRKGDKLEIVPVNLQVCGLQATNNKSINWGQLLAFRQLTDNGVHCVFLQGKPGTGKTLLAIAAALEQHEKFEQLILVNPMVPLSNQQKMGFLPGDAKDKLSPWFMPFSQNIRFLEKKQKARMSRILSEKNKNNGKKSNNGNSNQEEKNYDLWEKYGFICQPLDYIRGQTIPNACIIIEEAQNLSQHEIKTIITRAGDGTKLIFCGDLSQIDSPYISAKNSGLTYAIERMSGGNHKNKMIGVSILTKTVRSKLSSFASEVM